MRRQSGLRRTPAIGPTSRTLARVPQLTVSILDVPEPDRTSRYLSDRFFDVLVTDRRPTDDDRWPDTTRILVMFADQEQTTDRVEGMNGHLWE
jgi:hypothetical protein